MSDHRIIWLASYPKSGNTWVRSFLATYFLPPEQAPDINTLRRFTTGDVRADFYETASGRTPFQAKDFDEWLRIRQKALLLIARSKPTQHFVKTHSRLGSIGVYPLIPPGLTAGALYLIRNPFDVCQSYSRHLGLSVDKTIDIMLNPEAKNASPAGIFEVVGRWDDHIASWTGAPGLQHHVMRYEDMIAATDATFRALIAFFGLTLDKAAFRRAMAATSFDALKRQEEEKGFIERPAHMKSFFAKGQVGSWRDTLSPAQVARLSTGFAPTIARYWPEMQAEVDAVAAKA
ncbi:MAG: sulfotransferase domain-containing protein [Pseudomonadota bacterium]